MDPLAGKYPGCSPYNYTLLNPVKLVDPDGRSVDLPDDHWKLNSSGELELIKKTDDNFNVFYDENGRELFRTNEKSLELTSKYWSSRTDEYINKMKIVFIDIANDSRVYKTMNKRANETGFDNSLVSLRDMKSIGQKYIELGTTNAILDIAKEAPKWMSNPGFSGKDLAQQLGKGIYKRIKGTDLLLDSKYLINKVWKKTKTFFKNFSNGDYIDGFMLH